MSDTHYQPFDSAGNKYGESQAVNKHLVEIRVTPQAIAVLHDWIKSGDITISEAIIARAKTEPTK